MKKAITYLETNNSKYYIPNNLLIDKIIESGLTLDNRIAQNPYFQYHLFNIFAPLKNAIITSINIDHNDMVININTLKDTYKITSNEENGLLLNNNYETNDGSSLFTNIGGVYQLFPLDNGMMLVEHQKLIISNIDIGTSSVEEKIKLKFIDYNGLVDNIQVIDVKTCDDLFIWNRQTNLPILKLKEYTDIFKQRINISNCTYLYKKRDCNNILKVYEYDNILEYDSKLTKYFNGKELLDILDLDNFYSEKKIEDNVLHNQILSYNLVDKTVADLLYMITQKLGCSIDIVTINDDKIYNLDDVLLKPKQFSV